MNIYAFMRIIPNRLGKRNAYLDIILITICWKIRIGYEY
jgi:hypothetical protein